MQSKEGRHIHRHKRKMWKEVDCYCGYFFILMTAIIYISFQQCQFLSLLFHMNPVLCAMQLVPFVAFIFGSASIQYSVNSPYSLHFSATSDFMSFRINKLFTSISKHFIGYGHCLSISKSICVDINSHFCTYLLRNKIFAHGTQHITMKYFGNHLWERELVTASSTMMASKIDFLSQFIKKMCYSPLSLGLPRFYYYVSFLSVTYANESVDVQWWQHDATTVSFNEIAPKQKLLAEELRQKKSVNTSFCQIKKEHKYNAPLLNLIN